MAKRLDYKKTINRHKEFDSQSSTLRGVLYGLSLGLLTTALVHIYHISKLPSSTQSKEDTQQVEPQSVWEETIEERLISPPDRDISKSLLADEVPIPKVNKQYLLQLANFRGKEDAESLKKKVLGIGYNPKIRILKEKNSVWYHVQMGPFQELAKAEEVQKKLKWHKIEAMIKQQ